MQQAISALHWLLQDIYGLVDNLTQACSNSKQTLQCIYALCDGTKESVANVPDIQIFANNGTGIVDDPCVYQHIQLHLLVQQISKQFSTQETAHTCKAECKCFVMLQGPCLLSPCLLHVYSMSTSCLLHVYFMSSKLSLHLLLPVQFLPGSNDTVVAVIRVCICYGKYLRFMMCAMSCRMLSTHRSNGQQQGCPCCKIQLFCNRQA